MFSEIFSDISVFFIDTKITGDIEIKY